MRGSVLIQSRDGKSDVHHRLLFIDVCTLTYWTMGDWIQVSRIPETSINQSYGSVTGNVHHGYTRYWHGYTRYWHGYTRLWHGYTRLWHGSSRGMDLAVAWI